jgi:poly(hydroxyalkanoate) granule-associated protein
MAKKKSKKRDVGGDVRASAHKVWLAGLGALAAAEQEGTKVFNHLVHLGEGYDDTLRGEARKASSGLKSRAGDVRKKAGSVWKTLEESIEAPLQSALHRLDLPDRGEIARLNRKVEELARTVVRMKSSGAKRRKTSGKKTAGKKAGKKTSRKSRG